jgi:hypothetical protein
MMLAGLLSTIGGPRVTLEATYTVSDSTISPTNASASFQLQSDGDVARITVSTGGGGTVDVGDWITPAAAAGANYEVRATVNSGSLTSGSTGTWLALSSTRTWSLDQTSLGTSACELLIEIRLTSTGAVLDSTVVSLSAEKSI